MDVLSRDTFRVGKRCLGMQHTADCITCFYVDDAGQCWRDFASTYEPYRVEKITWETMPLFIADYVTRSEKRERAAAVAAQELKTRKTA